MLRMLVNRLIHTDALEGLKKLPDNSVTLVCTSPPYADIRSSYQGVKASSYVDWFKPYLKEILRVLKEDGSFILNIKDKCENGERIPYPFEIVLEARKLGLKFLDTIIWEKKNGIVGGKRRRADYFEYIFHFGKTTKPKFFPDEIRTEYAPSSIKRAEKPIKNNVSNREGRTSTVYKQWELHEKGAWPKNVIKFKKDLGRDHPASFDISLPTHFILAHTEPNDLVLDIFAGRGTTLEAAKRLNRSYLGFELKKEYVLLAQTKYGLAVEL